MPGPQGLGVDKEYGPEFLTKHIATSDFPGVGVVPGTHSPPPRSPSVG